MADRSPTPDEAGERTAAVYARTVDGPAGGNAIPHVVVVGAACRDVTGDDPRGWRLGGGATYSALTMARLGVRTALLFGADQLAAAAAEMALVRDAGAAVTIAALATGPIFENIETLAGRVQICIQTSDHIAPSALPGSWAGAPAWMIAPVAGETGDEWAGVPPPDAIVALGWQGLLRDLVPGQRVGRRAPAASALVERADIIGVSHHDVAADGQIDELMTLLRPGAQLLLTRGAAGGLLVRRGADGKTLGRRYPALAPARTVDPTGAGDTFLAALVATRLMPEFQRARRRGGDLRFAAAAASLVVEGPGLAGVPDLATVVRRTRASLDTDTSGMP